MGFKSEASMHLWVRIAGVFYLAIIVIGAVDHLVLRDPLMVPGDTTATALNILAAQNLWRAGIAADVVMQMLDIPVILVLYLLFKTVNSRIALLALLFNLVQTAVLVANKQNLVQVIQILLSVEPETAGFGQMAEQALLLIHLHNYGFSIGLIFFGVSCCLYGYLIYNSGFLPRVLGFMIALAGASYLVSSFALILDPAIGGALVPLLAFSLIGEVSFALWLVSRSVAFQTVDEMPIEMNKHRSAC